MTDEILGKRPASGMTIEQLVAFCDGPMITTVRGLLVSIPSGANPLDLSSAIATSMGRAMSSITATGSPEATLNLRKAAKQTFNAATNNFVPSIQGIRKQ